ncbi:MAG: hypothetical protein ACLGI6_00615 [Gammaproteobacteria bacterium]
MCTDSAVRLPLRALRSRDLSSFPVWEWAVGEEHQQDASLLRPTAHACVPLDVDGQFIVAASATLNQGEQVPACVEVNVRRGKARMTPLFLIAQNRQLAFVGEDTTRVLNQYTRRLNSYAVAWQLAVALEGAAAPAGRRVKRSLAARLQQGWLRLRIAAGAPGLLTP